MSEQNGAPPTQATGPYCNTTGACVTNCTSDAHCGPGNDCDRKDDRCGYANGDGPCSQSNASTVCRSGTCGASSNECIPTGGNGCASDGDCSAGTYCNGATRTCAATLANGQGIPTDPLHLDVCTTATGAAVCTSKICDTDDKCGLANGDSTCSTGPQCRSTAGANSGKCEPSRASRTRRRA